MITAVITKKGRILQNKQVNGADLVFTRAVAGTATTTADKLQDQTTISSIAQTLSIQSVKLDDSKQSYTILVLLENTNLKTAYNLNQIGFYANDPNDGEILFAIAQFDTPKKIELPTVNPGYTLEMPFTFQNSNSANVKIDFSPDNLMSRAGVQAMLDSEEISGISSGNIVAVTNSAESPFLDFKLFGKSEQVVTTGANLLDTSNQDTFFNNMGSTKTGVVFPIETDGVYTYYVEDTITAYIGYTDSLETNAVHIASCLKNKPAKGKISLKAGQYFLIWFDTGITVADSTYYFLALGENVPFEPFTGCKPAPSPDYPQEIKSTGEDGSVDLNVQGKNLWTVDNTNDNLTYDAATQVMTISGAVNLTVHKLPVSIPKGTTVTISAKVISGKVTSDGDGGLAFGGYYKPDSGAASWQGYINIPKCSVADLTGQEYKQIFQTTKEVTHFYAFVYASTAAIHEPLKVKVQYEVNNYATDFEPHKTSQMANIPTPNGLRGIPVSSGGNYTDKNGQQWICDEIDLAKRKYIQRVSEYTANKCLGAGTNSDFDVYIVQIPRTKTDMLLSPYIRIIPMNDIVTNVGQAKMLFDIGQLYLAYSEKGESTTESFEEWITEIGGIPIIYPLAEPIETDLTDEQIAAFESLTAYENTTTILMDGIGEMEIQYFKDTSNGKAMGILKSEHVYLKKLIGDVNTVVKNLVG